MVRRGRDQPDARGGEAKLGDVGVDLVAGQLAALAGLRALRDLDLDLVGGGEVVNGDPEASRGHLLDPRAALVAVRVGRVAADVLAALARVRHPADPVHRHRQRLVGLRAERAEAHPAGGEALEDLGHRLDLVDRDRVAGGPQVEQAAEHRQGAVLDVDPAAKLVVALGGLAVPVAVLVGAHRELQGGDRLRVPGVALAVAPPGVDAALGQQAGVGGGQRRVLDVLGKAAPVARGVGARVALERLAGELGQPDAADRRRGAAEVAVDQIAVEPDRLEHLGAAVGGDRRDPHLRHHLQQALADRLQQPLGGLGLGEAVGQLGAAVEIGRSSRAAGRG